MLSVLWTNLEDFFDYDQKCRYALKSSIKLHRQKSYSCYKSISSGGSISLPEDSSLEDIIFLSITVNYIDNWFHKLSEKYNQPFVSYKEITK